MKRACHTNLTNNKFRSKLKLFDFNCNKKENLSTGIKKNRFKINKT